MLAHEWLELEALCERIAELRERLAAARKTGNAGLVRRNRLGDGSGDPTAPAAGAVYLDTARRGRDRPAARIQTRCMTPRSNEAARQRPAAIAHQKPVRDERD